MAQAKKIPGLDADMEFREAAARAVEVRSREVFSFESGVLDTDDAERVHDMRVASRRLRAVLEVFEACFPRQEHKVVLKEVKRLADALGERRDPDVAIGSIQTFAAGVGEAERPGLDGLVAELRARQRAGNEALEVTLERIRQERLAERLLTLAERARAG
jgi:CHAD domain-containing protein